MMIIKIILIIMTIIDTLNVRIGQGGLSKAF